MYLAEKGSDSSPSVMLCRAICKNDYVLWLNIFKVIKMSFDVYIVQFAWMRCLQYFLWSWVMLESIGFDQTVREAG